MNDGIFWLVAPSARLEHATYCSASKRSNPLSYEGIHRTGIAVPVLVGRDFNSESEAGQEKAGRKPGYGVKDSHP